MGVIYTENRIFKYHRYYLLIGMKPQKVLGSNRITLPDSFINKWQIKEGDYVLVDVLAKGLVVLPADFKPKKEIKN